MKDITLEGWSLPDPPSHVPADISALYHDARSRAEQVSSWYISDKRAKARMSRFLRGAAVVFATAGGVLPVIFRHNCRKCVSLGIRPPRNRGWMCPI